MKLFSCVKLMYYILLISYNYVQKNSTKNKQTKNSYRNSPCSVMVKALNFGQEVNEFELQSH